ncbi:MAG: hypothetical protein HHAS10_06360 [Candidatus Altimarinota bacterium]
MVLYFVLLCKIVDGNRGKFEKNDLRLDVNDVLLYLMNQPSFENTQAAPELTHQRDNPISRITCRNRILVPTICDGTCRSCRRERESYFHEESERVLKQINANPSLGSSMEHEDDPITLEQAQLIVLRRIAKIDLSKEKYIP